ncbi:unnamed protein product [Prorocentrum cordatum]|uniref:Cyclic nucleotide-binding domain-containing protein n=1 Tax=Prorocentrum cordatum TaxID=2364126 RepID=A0ABN9TIX9_9DINO|nr:unnamed protein product [Polarella glacialis]
MSEMPTRYSRATETATCIDRAFVSLPPQYLEQLICDFEVHREAANYADWRLSDHAAAVLRIRPRIAIERDAQSIPKHIFKSPMYAATLGTLMDALDLVTLPPEQRLSETKRMMKEAARLTQNALSKLPLGTEMGSPETLEARRLIVIENSAIVRLVDATSFEHEYHDLNRRWHERQVQLAAWRVKQNESPERADVLQRLEALARRRAALWAPFRKRLVLNGLQLHSGGPDGPVARQPGGIADALLKYWAPVFLGAECDASALDEFLDSAMPSMPLVDLATPARLPRPRAMDHVYPVMLKLFEGTVMAPGLNASDFACLPKGSPEEGRSDLVDCVRQPHQTRPLSLNSQDSKAIASAINWNLKRVAERATDEVQQGFISGRNFIKHILVMDTECRIASMGPGAVANHPVFISFDFSSALASLNRTYLSKVLVAALSLQAVKCVIVPLWADLTDEPDAPPGSQVALSSMPERVDATSLAARLGALEDSQREICGILRGLDAKLDAVIATSAVAPAPQQSQTQPRSSHLHRRPRSADRGPDGRGQLPSASTTREQDLEAGEEEQDDDASMFGGSGGYRLRMRSGYGVLPNRRNSSASDGSALTRGSLSRRPSVVRKMRRRPTYMLDAAIQGGEEAAQVPLTRFRAWNPDSRSRTFYNFLTVLVLLYDAFVLPIMVAWDFDHTSNPVLFGVLATSIFWTIDLPLCFITGFRDKGAILNLDVRACTRRYLSSWFAVDLLVVVNDWVSELEGSLRNLRFLRLVRIVRVGKQSVRVYGWAQKLKVAIHSEELHLASDVLLIFLAILWANHVVCCIWYAIGRYAEPDTGYTWLSEPEYSAAGFHYEYWTSLHWAFTQMTPGSMEVFPASTDERIFNVATLFLGLLCGSTLVATLTSMMTQYKIRLQGSADKFNRLQKFLAQEEIDQGLAMAIKLQVKVRLAETEQVRQQDVEYLNLAPKSLQESLWHFRCMKKMSDHVLWNAMNRFDSGSIHAVCYRSIVETKLDKEDLLFEDGADGDSMYFVSSGQLKYRPGELAAEVDLPDVHPRLLVKPGGWCSEPALWTDWSHVGTMEAVSTCDTLQISCPRLMRALDRMPEILEITSDYCRAFHGYLEDIVRLSDLPGVVDYHELMLGLGITSRVKLADPLIQKLRSRTFFSQKAIDLLEAEIADGKCNITDVGSEMVRTVFVVALRIQRGPRDQRILVKVGEVLRENGDVVPYCVLPGIKRGEQRCSKEVVDLLLETELLELKDHVQVDYTVPPEQVPIIQTSDQYHIRTRYLRTTFSASMAGEEADKGLAWTTIANLRTFGPRRSKESASFGPRRSKESALSEVRHRAAEILNRQDRVLVLKCQGENRAACKLYLWLAQQEFDELSQDSAKPVLKQWAGDLDCSELC